LDSDKTFERNTTGEFFPGRGSTRESVKWRKGQSSVGKDGTNKRRGGETANGHEKIIRKRKGDMEGNTPRISSMGFATRC